MRTISSGTSGLYIRGCGNSEAALAAGAKSRGGFSTRAGDKIDTGPEGDVVGNNNCFASGGDRGFLLKVGSGVDTTPDREDKGLVVNGGGFVGLP